MHVVSHHLPTHCTYWFPLDWRTDAIGACCTSSCKRIFASARKQIFGGGETLKKRCFDKRTRCKFALNVPSCKQDLFLIPSSLLLSSISRTTLAVCNLVKIYNTWNTFNVIYHNSEWDDVHSNDTRQIVKSPLATSTFVFLSDQGWWICSRKVEITRDPLTFYCVQETTINTVTAT
jgi:hypothetical protein